MTVACRGRSVARASAVTATGSTTSAVENRGCGEASNEPHADDHQAAQPDDSVEESGSSALGSRGRRGRRARPDARGHAEQHADEREPERHERGSEES